MIGVFIDPSGTVTYNNEVVLMDNPQCRNGNHYFNTVHRCADCGVLDLFCYEAEIIAKWFHDELTIRKVHKAWKELENGIIHNTR